MNLISFHIFCRRNGIDLDFSVNYDFLNEYEFNFSRFRKPKQTCRPSFWIIVIIIFIIVIIIIIIIKISIAISPSVKKKALTKLPKQT